MSNDPIESRTRQRTYFFVHIHFANLLSGGWDVLGSALPLYQVLHEPLDVCRRAPTTVREAFVPMNSFLA